MKRFLYGFFVVLTALILWNSSCLASGFALYENSPSGSAVCGAFAATADDVSSVWYNPAGLVQLDGTHVMTGFTTYTGNGAEVNFDGGESNRSDNFTIPVPYLYLSNKLNEKIWLGFGIFSPFGLTAEYDKDWAGRYNTYYSGNLAREYNGNIVYKVNDALSFGIGLSLQQFEVEFKQKINAGAVYLQGGGTTSDPLYSHLATVDFDQRLFADEDSELRYNLSLLYKINEKISFGMNYRSEVDYTLKGDATYSDVPAVFSTQLHNAGIEGSVTLPMVIWTGIACKVTPKLTIETDLVMTGWSSYDKLEFNIDNSLGRTVVQKNWDDVYSIRFGVDYQLTESFAVRCGYLYDESPIPAETLDYAMPSSDRHMVSTGFGYSIGQWTVDTHYAYVTLIGDRSIATRPSEFMLADSTVESAGVHQLGMSLSYNF